MADLPFRKILVPLDRSELAEQALEPALQLAEAAQGQLIVLHVPAPQEILVTTPVGYGIVWPEQSTSQARRQGSEYLERLRQSRFGRLVNVQTVMIDGDPAGAIVDTARAEDVDLIVMSTHGYSGFTRWILGSVTEKTLRAAPCPVLVIRSYRPIQHLVIALDGSQLAERALAPGMALAQIMGARVTLLRIEQAADYIDVFDTRLLDRDEPELGQHVLDHFYRQTEAYLERVAEPYQAQAIDVTTVVRRGYVAQNILDFAANEEVDLIVMSTHGRTGLRRWVYGSIAEKVLARAQSHVLIVRPPADSLHQ